MVIGSSPIAPIFYHKEKEVLIINQITKKEMDKLFKHGILKQTAKGIVNKEGKPTGFFGTRTKRYIEDKYIEIARKLH